MSETLNVTVVEYRYRNLRRGSAIGTVLADIMNPLPPRVLWTLEDRDRVDYAGRPLCYRTKSGKLPKRLAEAGVESGDQLTIRGSVTPWGNGLGGDISNVTVLDAMGGES